MSLSTLIFGGRKQVSIGALQVDVLESETIEMTSQSTDHAVETGVNISDHFIKNPRKVSATFTISDWHLRQSTVQANRAQAAYELLKLQRELQHTLGMPFSYVSHLEVFPFMHFESISVPRNNSHEALTFDVTMKEITVLLPLGVSIPTELIDVNRVNQLASLVTL